MFDKDQIIIYHNGEPQYALNKMLIEKQGLTKEEVLQLIDLHEQKLALFDSMKETNDPVLLKEGAKTLELLEYGMQTLWHFEKDANFHEWYLIPKCECPVLDNQDRRGTGYRVYTQGCPVHGEELNAKTI